VTILFLLWQFSLIFCILKLIFGQNINSFNSSKMILWHAMIKMESPNTQSSLQHTLVQMPDAKWKFRNPINFLH